MSFKELRVATTDEISRIHSRKPAENLNPGKPIDEERNEFVSKILEIVDQNGVAALVYDSDSQMYACREYDRGDVIRRSRDYFSIRVRTTTNSRYPNVLFILKAE